LIEVRREIPTLVLLRGRPRMARFSALLPPITLACMIATHIKYNHVECMLNG